MKFTNTIMKRRRIRMVVLQFLLFSLHPSIVSFVTGFGIIPFSPPLQKSMKFGGRKSFLVNKSSSNSYTYNNNNHNHINKNEISTSSLLLLQMNIGYLSDYYDYYENKEDKFREETDGVEDEDFSDDEYDLDESKSETVLDYGEESEDMEETIVLEPVPYSPNFVNGAKYIAVFLDSELDVLSRSKEELFRHRQKFNTIKSHVRWAREANLVNETVHTWKEDVKVDIPFSYSILSTDQQSEIGSIICLNAQSSEDALKYLAKEPMIKYLLNCEEEDTNGDGVVKVLKKSNLLFQWRHAEETKLRQDDGRFGLPYAMIGLDAKKSENLRDKHAREHYEYLIRSERVIASGSLLSFDTENSSDSESKTVGEGIGDIVFFNAPSRSDAILFAESDPLSLQGVYESLRVQRYNTIDVTGKHVAMDKYARSCNDVVFNEMEEEGYAVYDYQTPWVR